MERHVDVQVVRAIVDLTQGQKGFARLRLIFARQTMARPYVAPPGLPEDRKQALRTAFEETMKDPDFLAEAQKTELEVHPVTGAEIDKLLGELYATPKHVIQLAIDAIGTR